MSYMISFERSTFIDRMKYYLIPSYRKKVDAEMKAAIKWLILHPEAPCMVDGHLIPNGYGKIELFTPFGF